MPVKHTKVSSIPDGADTTLIRPSDWNADHGVDFNVVSVSTGTLLTVANELVLVTTGSSNITIALPDPTTVLKHPFYIKKVDSGSGMVVLDAGAKTIDGASTFELVNRWQYVVVVSDGSNWVVISNN